jgi:hypothetical protein
MNLVMKKGFPSYNQIDFIHIVYQPPTPACAIEREKRRGRNEKGGEGGGRIEKGTRREKCLPIIPIVKLYSKIHPIQKVTLTLQKVTLPCAREKI